MFLFFLHNHKSYLLLSVRLIGRNLGRSCQDGVCNVLSVLFDYRCEERWEICVISGEKVFNLTDFVCCMFSGKLFHSVVVDGGKMIACKSQFYVLVPVVGVVVVDGMD